MLPPHGPPEPHRRPRPQPVSAQTRDPFGTTAAGEEVAVFTLTNDGGAVVRLLEIGAVVAGIEVPDRAGDLADVVLGFDTVAEYEANPPYFGCATGRVANRIAGGRFELDGRVVQLAVNAPPNHIHGGEGGFHRALWRGEPEDAPEGPGVRFRRLSPDGEDGYPGALSVEILYTLTRAHGLRIDYLATTDRPTPVNLTNHSYFQLGGHGAGSVLDHVITIKASRCTARDDTGLPGAIQSVEGTPLDLRDPARPASSSPVKGSPVPSRRPGSCAAASRSWPTTAPGRSTEALRAASEKPTPAPASAGAAGTAPSPTGTDRRNR